MSVQAVLLPVFAYVALVFVVLFGMISARYGSFQSGQTKISDVAAGKASWSVKASRWSDCFRNQFEVPVIFFALIALGLPLRKIDFLLVVLSWLFVLTRYAHVGIFVTTNNLRWRGPSWFAGVVVLLVMWVYFALSMLLII